MAELTIEILANTKPLMLFIEFIKGTLESREKPIDFADLESDLVRFEVHPKVTTPNTFIATFYPSNKFLHLASAICAGE